MGMVRCMPPECLYVSVLVAFGRMNIIIDYVRLTVKYCIAMARDTVFSPVPGTAICREQFPCRMGGNHFISIRFSGYVGGFFVMMGRSSLKKTKRQLESEISDAITRFEKEHMGRGPLETRTYIVEDMVIIRQQGALTRAEHVLIKSDRNVRARELIKQVRSELIESGRHILEDIIKDILRRKIRSLHTDVSTKTGEKVIIFTLDRVPETE
jgi:uncharacterized protein YbcI